MEQQPPSTNDNKSDDKDNDNSNDGGWTRPSSPEEDENQDSSCLSPTKRRRKRELPKVIFVTAHVSQSYETMCKEAGGWGFVPKPFKLATMKESMQKVAAAIGTHRHQRICA